MATDPCIVPAIAPVSPIAAATATPGPPDSASFRRLLESLERLAKEHRTVPPVEDAQQLQEAIRHVDDGFTTAMDLRKKLEEAFRGRLQ